MFGIRPEAFNAVDMRTGFGELIVRMVDAKVLGVADIDKPIVAGPAVRMDDAVQVNAAANRFAQSIFRHIGYDLGVDAVAPFEHPEDDGLVSCSASTLAPHPSRPEVGFIDFYFPPEGGFEIRNARRSCGVS